MLDKITIEDCFIGASCLNEADKSILAGLHPQHLRFPKGSVIVRQGDLSDQMVIVEEGWIFSCRYLEDGARQVMDLHFPGEVTGWAELTQSHHLCHLVSLTDTRLLCYDKAELMQAFSASSHISRALFELVNQGQVALSERVVSLARHNALQRLCGFLVDVQHRASRYARQEATEPSVTLNDRDRSAFSGVLDIPHTIIADSLGLSNVHVSRTLALLREQGLISSRAGKIRLLDLGGLRLAAGFKPKPRWSFAHAG